MNYLASLPSTIADIPLHRLLVSGLTHNDAKWNGKNFPGLLHTAPGGGRKGPKPIQRFRLSFFVGQIGSADVLKPTSQFFMIQSATRSESIFASPLVTVMFSWS